LGVHITLSCPPPAPPLEPTLSACFAYREPIMRDIIEQFKKVPNRRLMHRLLPLVSDLIFEDIAERLIFHKKILLVPIPLHPSRLHERGFNQATLIAQSLATLDSRLHVSEVLERTIQREKQALLEHRDDREKNIAGSFSLKPSYSLEGIACIVIDDVTTSGATYKEARRVLLAHGAHSVFGIMLAH
jgi:ComF family protein